MDITLLETLTKKIIETSSEIKPDETPPDEDQIVEEPTNEEPTNEEPTNEEPNNEEPTNEEESHILNDKYGIYDKFLGQGGYGVVESLVKDSKVVAVKKYKVAKDNYITSCLREVATLNILKGHPNIVEIIDVVTDDKYINIVLEYIDEKFPNYFHPQEVPTYFYQMCRVVDYCHTYKIWHRDLKPSNFLLRTEGETKKVILIDFSMGCFSNCIKDDHSPKVTTSWYRAPEVYMEKSYNEKIDVWSLGCIFGEMLLGNPMFNEEESINLNNIFLIIDNLAINNLAINNLAINNLASSMNNHPEALHLLKNMLKINPEERIGTKDVLNHFYFDKVRSVIENLYPTPLKSHPFDYMLLPNSAREAQLNDMLEIITQEKLNVSTWYSTILIYDQIINVNIPYNLKPALSLLLASYHHDILPLLPMHIAQLLGMSYSEIKSYMLFVLNSLNYKLNIFREGTQLDDDGLLLLTYKMLCVKDTYRNMVKDL